MEKVHVPTVTWIKAPLNSEGVCGKQAISHPLKSKSHSKIHIFMFHPLSTTLWIVLQGRNIYLLAICKEGTNDPFLAVG